ncbi:hypothetical protein CEXT_262891 [Caerostris extrusa]|uniref:C2H2-type domain-containing protein n=1 Tax=Caerostris extrusa TaxID=172846 RepID=A0AAV4Q5H5_CAEEX|nr:hypothetical protein CEXT_262891 [Caerostris extrusa]
MRIGILHLTRERYEIVHRINPSNSPSHTTVHPGWYSDGQDSGIASSPSPSSEDGEFAQKANPTRYQCPDCNKSYSTYSGLSKHRLMHCATQAKKSSVVNIAKKFTFLWVLSKCISEPTLCLASASCAERPSLDPGYCKDTSALTPVKNLSPVLTQQGLRRPIQPQGSPSDTFRSQEVQMQDVQTVVTSLSTDRQSGFGGAPRRACEMALKEKGDAPPVRSGKQHVFPSGAVNGRISAVERLPDDHRLP